MLHRVSTWHGATGQFSEALYIKSSVSRQQGMGSVA
jgi:hypothetical protein